MDPEIRPGRTQRAARWMCLAGLCLVALAAAGGCRSGLEPAFSRLLEARRLAADLRVSFHKAADASDRAVMADTDEASIAFAKEAEQATQAVQRDADALLPILRDLSYREEQRALEEFDKRFGEYRALDRKVLELAVENTNLKAQKLSFGPAQDAADAFRRSLDAVVAAAPVKDRCKAESLAAGAVIAVRDIQVLEAPHIAESTDEAMARMEQQMAAREALARDALRALAGLGPAGREPLAAATTALDRFKAVHAQIIILSRRNSNIRSLELSLGQLRTLTAAVDASISALQDALAREGFRGTR